MEFKLVIVDGYSSGNLMAGAFRAKGASVFHVQSTPQIHSTLAASFVPSDYISNYPFDGNMEKLLRWCEQLSPSAIIAGTETGVELADRLAGLMRLPMRNDSNTSQARRNKFNMQIACSAAGLPCAWTHSSSSAQELARVFSEKKLNRAILKPVSSAWTDGVLICETAEQVLAGARSIIGHENILGLKNMEALLQEYLDGDEYFLNAVALNGEYKFTDVWRYHKSHRDGADFVYDYDDLCGSSDSTVQMLQDYVEHVLRATGVLFGPAHVEVKNTSKGPRLIELGARLDGLINPSLLRKCVGYSALDVLIDQQMNQENFVLYPAREYPLHHRAKTVYLHSGVRGLLDQLGAQKLIESLPSFFYLRWRAKDREPIGPTKNIFTCPGVVSLCHSDADQLELDYRQIRVWESSGLFLKKGND